MGPPPAPEKKSNPALILVLVMLAVLAIGGGAFLLTSGDDDDETATNSNDAGRPAADEASVTTLPGSPDDIDVDLPSDDAAGTDPASHDGFSIEEVAATAGAPALPPDGDPQFDGLEQQCYQGDMQACDDLYAQTPIGSIEEAYGDTCGARVPDAHSYYCTDLLPDPEPPAG